MVVTGQTEPWDPLECETELVYGYIAGLKEALFMVLYLSDAGMSQRHSRWLIPAFVAPLHRYS